MDTVISTLARPGILSNTHQRTALVTLDLRATTSAELDTGGKERTSASLMANLGVGSVCWTTRAMLSGELSAQMTATQMPAANEPLLGNTTASATLRFTQRVKKAISSGCRLVASTGQGKTAIRGESARL